MSDQPYQLLPPLTDDEYAALRADIAAAGVRVPIDVDENGTILNGHHRKAIADELGIDCPVRVVAGLDHEDKRAHALATNLNGRRLSREQRRALITAELEHDDSRSDRAIARLLGVDHKTVGAVRRERRGEFPTGPMSVDEIWSAARLDKELDDLLLDLDISIVAALLAGHPPTEFVEQIQSALTEFERGFDDEEVRRVMREFVVGSRVRAIESWPESGGYVRIATEVPHGNLYQLYERRFPLRRASAGAA